ncbi:MAG: hypothetical protein ACYC6G_16635 [Desulfobaccales bacterium]
MQKEGIYLVGEASVPDDVIRDVEYYFKRIGPDFHVEIIPDKGPQAGLEWLLPTVLIIFFAKPFIETLAKEMSSDFYKLIKLGISSIWSKFFGQNPKYKYIKIVTGKQLQEDFDFSPAFSIYTELSDGIRIKFLYKQGWTLEEFDEATDAYLHNIALFYQDSDLMEILEKSTIRRTVILLTFDERTKVLEIIDPVPHQVQNNKDI